MFYMIDMRGSIQEGLAFDSAVKENIAKTILRFAETSKDSQVKVLEGVKDISCLVVRGSADIDLFYINKENTIEQLSLNLADTSVALKTVWSMIDKVSLKDNSDKEYKYLSSFFDMSIEEIGFFEDVFYAVFFDRSKFEDFGRLLRKIGDRLIDISPLSPDKDYIDSILYYCNRLFLARLLLIHLSADSEDVEVFLFAGLGGRDLLDEIDFSGIEEVI